MPYSLRKFVPVLVSGALTLYVVARLDIADVATELFSLSWPWLLGIMALLAGNMLSVSMRLGRLLRDFGVPQSFRTAFRANVSGLASSLILISLLGAVLGRQIVLQRQGISPALITVLTGYERAVLLLVGCGLAVLGGLVLFGTSFWRDFNQALPLWQFLLAVALAIGFSLRLARRGTEIQLLASALSWRNLGRIGAISGITLCAQAFAISTYVLAFLALGTDAAPLQLLAGAAVVSFAASLPISVNGWGVRELAAIAVFGQLGASPHEAVAGSVLVGLCSTIAILVATPYALVDSFRSTKAAATAEATMPSGQGKAVSPPPPGLADREMNQILAILCGLGAAVLLFFQIRLEISGNAVTVNLADPIALSALSALVAYFLFRYKLPIALPRPVWLWLGGITLVLMVGFLNGVLQFGVTPWALSNRLFGWFVILGYVACGALVASQFGIRGRIRVVQTLLATAVVVVLVHSLARFLSSAGVVDWVPPIRFEGFSANRNTLAFQLTVVLAATLSWGYRPIAASGRVMTATCIILSFGILQTGSLTGLLSWFALFLVLNIIQPDRRRLLAFGFGGGILLWVAGYVLLDPLIDTVLALLDPMTQETAGRAPRTVPGFSIVPTSYTQRLDSVRSGFQMWLENPLFGAGLGAGIQASLAENKMPVVIHSTFVWLFAELGIVGALVALALPASRIFAIFAVFVKCRSFAMVTMRHAAARHSAFLSIGMVFLLFSLAHDVGFQRILWLLVGAAAVLPAPLNRICRQDTPIPMPVKCSS